MTLKLTGLESILPWLDHLVISRIATPTQWLCSDRWVSWYFFAYGIISAYSTSQLELPDQTDTQLNNASPSTWDTIQCELDLMPDRQIVDFLVQYFVYELNW